MGFSPVEFVTPPEESVSPAAQEASSTMGTIIKRVQEAQALEPKMPRIEDHPRYVEFVNVMNRIGAESKIESNSKFTEAFFKEWLKQKESKGE